MKPVPCWHAVKARGNKGMPELMRGEHDETIKRRHRHRRRVSFGNQKMPHVKTNDQ